jgi:hypothetical protein
MRDLLKITAATAALAMGVSGANAAMLLTQDPQTGEKVVVDTEDPNYREQVIAGTGGTERPANCPEGAYFLSQDSQTGEQVVFECVGDRRFIVGEVGDGTVPPQDLPEGALFLTEDPETGEKETYTTPMEAPRHPQ